MFVYFRVQDFESGNNQKEKKNQNNHTHTKKKRRNNKSNIIYIVCPTSEIGDFEPPQPNRQNGIPEIELVCILMME